MAAKRKKTSRKAVSGKAKKSGKKASPAKANMMVTYNPSHQEGARNELQDALVRIGEKPRLEQAAAGIFKAKVSDARKVVARLKSMCQADPNIFSRTYHYVPVDEWCTSGIAAMRNAVKKAAKGISADDKWRMSVSKRKWEKLGEKELVLALTDVIDKENVDLESPQKIVNVEIVGKQAGVSLLTPEEIFDVAHVKEKS